MKKKPTHILLIIVACITFNTVSLSMGEAAPAVAAAAAAVAPEIIANVAEAAGAGHHDPAGFSNLPRIPSNFSFSVPTSLWLSGVGAFVSCLGGLLMYKGTVQRAQPIPVDKGDLTPVPEPTGEGTQLLASGSLFLLAGVAMILLSPKAN